MRKIYTNPVHLLRLLLPASFCFVNALVPHLSFGQSYYSNFTNTTGKYTVTEPSGSTCSAPSIQNASNFADADVSNFASFRGTISSPLTCDDNNYVFKTSLKMPVDTPSAAGGLQAGFRIKVSTSTDATVLTQYISIQTLLNNTPVESFSGKDVHVIDVAVERTKFVVYAVTTKNFNQVQMTVNGKIIPLNTDYEFDVLYGMATNTDLLPVTISNNKAIATGSSVTISWQSLNELNIGSYRIERSSNNGASYTSVGTLSAKGGSGAINYSYTDNTVGSGNYLYRVVAVDKDGLSKATNAMLVTLAGKTHLALMPSVVKAGQTVTVNTGITGSYQLAIYDVQGRKINEQVNSGDKATINTSSLSAGTYLVKITTASGSVSQAKFIVN